VHNARRAAFVTAQSSCPQERNKVSNGSPDIRSIAKKLKQMPSVFGHEVVRVGFVCQAEKLHVRNIARQAGRYVCLSRVNDSTCRQVHHESKNLVIRPALNFADVGQEQNREQFLENGLGKNQLKRSIQIGVHNAGRR